MRNLKAVGNDSFIEWVSTAALAANEVGINSALSGTARVLDRRV